MNMSTITISRTVKYNLDNNNVDNLSLDSFINHLLDCVDDDLKDVPIIDGNISVRISADTLERLRHLKRSNDDSYTKLLSDALSLYGSKI